MDYNKQPEGIVLPAQRGARHLSRFSVTDQTTNEFLTLHEFVPEATGTSHPF
jgi:hypothetical protein